eukprot:GILK01002003.1.p1 GENE.GILK01002003.1~~GILK01002003.1.p1  ORF type:complete len:271 (+),score=72.65 GILK01002003.1:150-962(+)
MESPHKTSTEKVLTETYGNFTHRAPAPLEKHGVEMMEAKRARQEAEWQVQMLENRLSRLRMEDQKTRKKIAETKHKASSILEQRERNMRESELKQKLQSEQNQTIVKQQKSSLKMAHNTRSKMQNIRTGVLKSKQQEVQQLKTSAKEYSEKLQKLRQDDLEKRAAIRNSIAKKEQQEKERRERERKAKEEELQRQFNQKLEEERGRTLVAAEKLRKLEQEESQLIDRLRQSYSIQKSVYDQLETVITSGGGSPSSPSSRSQSLPPVRKAV